MSEGDKYKRACGVLLAVMTKYGCTPEEGYANAPNCIESDIERAIQQREREAFEAGQKSVGWRDDMMERIDQEFEDWQASKGKK